MIAPPAETAPTPTNMYPSCETVEYAKTPLRSLLHSAMVAPSRAVNPPMTAMVTSTQGESWNTGNMRTTRYTPEVTMVAACTSADTGVGPAIASGSQTNSGNCADLPNAPSMSSSGIQVWTASLDPSPPQADSSAAACVRMPSLPGVPGVPCRLSVPYSRNSRNMPSSRQKSPMRLTMKAFLAAATATSFLK